MKSKDLLDAIGQLPQDLLEEGLPTRVGMPAEEESEAGEREMKMTKQPEQKRKIRLRMGAAVAAVCVLANAGLIYGLVRMNHKTTAPTVQTSLAEELSEQKTELPSYVTDMQAFYEKQSGVPCNVDFTNMGKTLDETVAIPDKGPALHLTGVVSDSMLLYVFYDIELINVSGHMSWWFTGNKLESEGECTLRQEMGDDGIMRQRRCALFLRSDPDASAFDASYELRLCLKNGDHTDDDVIPDAQSEPIPMDFITAPAFVPVNDENLRTGGAQITEAAVTPLGMYFRAKDAQLENKSEEPITKLPAKELEEDNTQLVTPDGSSKPVKMYEGWREQYGSEVILRMFFAEPLGGDTPAGSVLRINESEIPVGDLSRYFQQKPQEVQVADDNTQTKGYVEKMQKLYNTSYDFTGMGTDLDITWEEYGYKAHMTAVAGDAFRLYYFYDVYPLNGQEFDKDDQRDAYFPMPIFEFYRDGSKLNGSRTNENPLRLSTSNADGQEVWHMVGRVSDVVGIGMNDCKIYTCLGSQLSNAYENSLADWDMRAVKGVKEIPNFMKQPFFRTLSGGELSPFTRYAVTELGIVLTTTDLQNTTVDSYLAGGSDSSFSNLSLDLSAERWACEAFSVGKGKAEGTPVAWQNWEYSWMNAPLHAECYDSDNNELGNVVLFFFAEPLDLRPEKNEYLKLNGVPLAVSNPLPDFVAETTATVVTGDTTTTETTAATTAAPVGGILLTAENVTPYGCDIVFRNTGSQDAYYIEAFRIRTTDGNPLKEGNFAFIEPAYELPAGGTATKHYDWTEYYGKLEAGEYLFETTIEGVTYDVCLTVK